MFLQADLIRKFREREKSLQTADTDGTGPRGLGAGETRLHSGERDFPYGSGHQHRGHLFWKIYGTST